MSSATFDVAVPLQKLQKTLKQFEKNFCFSTPSQKAILEKYFDLFRNSQEELEKFSHRCQNELRVARRAICIIYTATQTTGEKKNRTQAQVTKLCILYRNLFLNSLIFIYVFIDMSQRTTITEIEQKILMRNLDAILRKPLP